jgi:uncharacterized protein (DUF58 family)
VRGYQPGDDIRAIDWRVTARTGAAHTKLFHEERERPVLLLVDQRAAMRFGSRHCFKSVVAAELAALLAWSALADNERIGALLLHDDDHRELRPRNNRRAVLALLSALAEPAADSGGSLALAEALRAARRIARPGTSLFILSDFHDALEDAAREELFQLTRHTEITALRIVDPLEQCLPPDGRYAVSDGRQRCELDTAGAALQARFAALLAAEQQALVEALQRLGIPLLEASTEDPPLSVLARYYGSSR